MLAWAVFRYATMEASQEQVRDAIWRCCYMSRMLQAAGGLRIKGVFNFLELQPVAKMLRQSDEKPAFLTSNRC